MQGLTEPLPPPGFERALYQVAPLASLEPTSADVVSLQAGLILQTLAALGRPATPEDVRSCVHRDLGVSIPLDSVVRAISHLLNDGIVTQAPNFAVSLQEDAKSQFVTQAEATRRLKSDVMRDWLDAVDVDLGARNEHALTAIQRTELEADLETFLLQLVRYHGAEVVAFLYPDSQVSRPVLEMNEPSLFSELPPRGDVVRELRRIALPAFVREARGLRATFIAGLLHRAALLQILQADASASALFSETLTPPILFLDTNFVFRLLGLQGEVLRAAAHDVLSHGRALAQRFCISQRTLEELEGVVEQQGDWVARDEDIPEALGEVASEFVSGNDYVSSYWRDRRRHGMTAHQFRDRYRQLRLLLENDGITVDPRLQAEILASPEFADATRVLKTFKPGEPAARVEHDAFHKALIERLRCDRSGLPPAGWHDVGFLFLTFDNRLPPYAAQLAAQRKGHRVPFCLMANEWLQILYFLRPSAQIRPEVFVALLNSPYLERYFAARAVNRDIVRSVMLTMGQLGELRGEVARKVLVDRVLTKALESTKDARRQKELTKEAVRRSAVEEDRRLESLQKEVQAKESRIAELESKLAMATRPPAVRPAEPLGNRAKKRERVAEQERRAASGVRRELDKRTEELEALKKRLDVSEREVTAVGLKIEALQASDSRRAELQRFVGKCVLLPAIILALVGSYIVWLGRSHQSGLLAWGSAGLGVVIYAWSRWIHRLAGGKPTIRDSTIFRWTFLVAQVVGWLLTLGGLGKHLLSHYLWEAFLKSRVPH